MQRFWAEYRNKLSRVQSGATRLAFASQDDFRVVRPRRQPRWGRITMAFSFALRRICHTNGHDRAERREQAWYPF